MNQLELAVHEAIASVDDPEYPGISIVDLGLLETIDISSGPQVGARTVDVAIGLVPTFGGCPALAMIGDDVEKAVSEVESVTSVSVTWLRTPVWGVNRVSADARSIMASEFTVAVKIGNTAPVCPRCGGQLRELSMFGPSRCRSVSRCDACTESIEVMRS